MAGDSSTLQTTLSMGQKFGKYVRAEERTADATRSTARSDRQAHHNRMLCVCLHLCTCRF
jgi:hypothetical protein